jgi:hypothetical protein
VKGINKVDTIDFVYNFEVKDFHNYLVGDNGIMVHNNYHEDIVDLLKMSREIKEQVI